MSAIPASELLRWTGGDPVVAAEFSPDVGLPALAVRDGDVWAVAFPRLSHSRGITLMLHGDDGSGELVGPPVVAALEELVASAPFGPWLSMVRSKGATSVSLPRAAADVGGLLSRVGGRWEWMSTTLPPEPVAGVELLDLDRSTRPQVQAFLDAHNPGTDGQPFARPGQRWVGVRALDGSLLAVGCCEPERSGAPVLAGITVHPAARGHGLGRAVTAELTASAVAEHGWCTLGMYSDNDRARGIYQSLGYRVGALWDSGGLA